MFSCITCRDRFTLEDVQKGLYFPSTGRCLRCYQTSAKRKTDCFGKESRYDATTIACGRECPDRKICRSFVKHKKEFQHHKGE